MPADHLKATDLATSVLHVLAGTPLTTAAATAHVDPLDLADAVSTYHAAGQAALQQSADSNWYQVRIEFPDWDTAETAVATHLGPRLDQLRDQGATGEWWFLRKHPQWRLRFDSPDIAAVNGALDEFTATGPASRWWPTLYEPETAAFGGPAGISTAHKLSCADSRGVLDYLRRPPPAVHRRELSLLLLGALLHAAGLDWFERGDVFANVAQMRPIPDPDDPRLYTITGNVRGLLAVPDAAHAMFSRDGPAGFAAPWYTAHLAAGQRLAAAAADGTLHRGLRRIISHIVIFHWNRLGISATTQGVLAHAATEAFLPRS